MGRLHVLAPDLAGQAGAGDALHLRIVVVADPDGRDELGCEADEPGVAVVLRRAGLAADLPARDVELAAGTAVHHAVEHGVDHGEILRLDDRAETRGLAGVNDLAVGLAHLADDIGQHRLAAIGERRVSGRHLQRRHLRGAERQRQVRLQGRGDAEALGGADDLLGCHLLNQPSGDRVERMLHRSRQRHRATIVARIVLRFPALDRDRGVVADGIRRHALLERGQIDEGLEGRARLAPRRRGAVELALGVVTATDQRADRAVRRERNDRALRRVQLGPLRRKRIDERRLGRALQLRIDRGEDGDIALDRADEVVEHVHHIIGGIVDRTGPDALRHLGGRGQRGLGRLLRDEALVGHRGDDELGPLLGRFGIAVRRQPRRGLDQAPEHRRLRDRHRTRRLVEVALRRRLDAIGARAEIDAVEIEFEDLVLGVGPLQPERQNRLLDLAGGRALLRQEQVLGELLRQGRAALRHTAAAQIGDERAGDADRVDAEMLVEALVLDGDEGLGQIGRNFADGNGAPAGLAAIGQERAVGREDRDVRRPLRHGELVDRRQLRSVIGDEAAETDGAPQAEHHRPVEQPTQERAAATAPAALAASPTALVAHGLAARLWTRRSAMVMERAIVVGKAHVEIIATFVAPMIEGRLPPLASFDPVVHLSRFGRHAASRCGQVTGDSNMALLRDG
ncbi:hypothetical protein BOSEA31B_11857 [Hyphomicrobiales bacterium]|nr:hypothetical protein BOSEA31B_11857 [Hyphomicrobiales bacterium]CAH1697637.1 hypothetical protein BOSEA1005_10682 [Hyphomicrobiales bacterium]CAI0347284.1 hypothetical protein BO1005MUT1_70065 [Hyphomicrobiales bacterium]